MLTIRMLSAQCKHGDVIVLLAKVILKQKIAVIAYTVDDKSYVREKFCGFRRLSMNREGFSYKCCEQWQHFQYR